MAGKQGQMFEASWDRQCKEPRPLREQGRGDLLEGEPAGEHQRDADLDRGGAAQY